MQTHYDIVMWDEGKPKELHLVTIGPEKWYVQVGSVQWFWRRETAKSSIYDKERDAYVVNFYKGKQAHVDIYNQNVPEEFKKYQSRNIYKDLPTFEHKSVFDFYEAVGYDRKKKKYLSEIHIKK